MYKPTHKQPIPGLRFEVMKICGCRYLQIVHTPSGKLTRFTSEPFRLNLTDMLAAASRHLGRRDWLELQTDEPNPELYEARGEMRKFGEHIFAEDEQRSALIAASYLHD